MYRVYGKSRIEDTRVKSLSVLSVHRLPSTLICLLKLAFSESVCDP